MQCSLLVFETHSIKATDFLQLVVTADLTAAAFPNIMMLVFAALTINSF
jgi:hypothetical protein